MISSCRSTASPRVRTNVRLGRSALTEHALLTGYHATSPETFAEAFHTVLTLPPEEDLALRQRARTWAVQRFSEAEFEKGWNESGWKKWLPS